MPNSRWQGEEITAGIRQRFGDNLDEAYFVVMGDLDGWHVFRER